MKCPECGEDVADYAEVHTEKVWCARDPMEGLTAWGAYSVEKELLHVKDQIAHIRFWDNTDRLVKMVAHDPD